MVVRPLPVAEVLAATAEVQRAGIIPYYWEDGKIYWVLHQEAQGAGDWGDSVQPDETAVSCALRSLAPELRLAVQTKLTSGDWSGVLGYANLTLVKRYWLLVPVPRPEEPAPTWVCPEQDNLVRYQPLTQYQAGLRELLRHLRRYHRHQ